MHCPRLIKLIEMPAERLEVAEPRCFSTGMCKSFVGKRFSCLADDDVPHKKGGQMIVIDTTFAVVKRKPEKNQSCTGFTGL